MSQYFLLKERLFTQVSTLLLQYGVELASLFYSDLFCLSLFNAFNMKGFQKDS